MNKEFLSSYMSEIDEQDKILKLNIYIDQQIQLKQQQLRSRCLKLTISTIALYLVYISDEIISILQKYIQAIELIIIICSIGLNAIIQVVEFNVIFFCIHKWIIKMFTMSIISNVLLIGATVYQCLFINNQNEQSDIEDLIVPSTLCGLIILLELIKNCYIIRGYFISPTQQKIKLISQVQQAIQSNESFVTLLNKSLVPLTESNQDRISVSSMKSQRSASEFSQQYLDTIGK